VRSTTLLVVMCGVLASPTLVLDAQGTRTPTRFRPEPRLFGRLFTAPRLRLPAPAPAEAASREQPANRECLGCEERPGTTHLVLDSPRLTPEWLSRHTYQSNGGSFGDNLAIADFWYDAVHRRVFSRSLVLHEVDDPADLRLGRAPGVYPGAVNASATLADGTTVGHVGFVTWTHNGFGSYFAALQGAVRDTGSGYLDLVTATGRTGTTRSGSAYDAQDLVKHVRLHPAGSLEIGFDTDPAARPDHSLLVRGDARIEGALSVAEALRAPELNVERLTTSAVSVGGGTVPHACSVRSGTGTSRDATIACTPGDIALSGGGTCASGELRGSRPTQTGSAPDGWIVTCSRDGAHVAYAICCSQ
jgi:hypothetical protein